MQRSSGGAEEDFDGRGVGFCTWVLGRQIEPASASVRYF